MALLFISTTHKPGITLNDWIYEVFLPILILEYDPDEGQRVFRWPWDTLSDVYC